MTNENAMIAAVLAFLTGGGLSQLIQAIGSHRKGVREVDVAHDEHALNVMRVALEELRAEVTRLAEGRKSDAAAIQAHRTKIDELNAQIADLVTENRRYRSIMAGIVDRLRADPPATPAELLDYLDPHVPKEDQ